MFSSDREHWHVALTFKLKLDSVKGYCTIRGYANLRIANARTGYLAEWSTRGLDNSRTSQHADWISRGLDNSRIPTMWTYRIISLICLSTYAKTLINDLTTIFNCILLWSTSIWHNDVFYVHIIIYLKLQLLPATSASCPVTVSRWISTQYLEVKDHFIQNVIDRTHWHKKKLTTDRFL